MNGNYKLPVIDTLSASWDKVYGSKLSIWGALGIYLLALIGACIITAVFSYFSDTLGQIANILTTIALTLLMYGIYYIGYKRSCDAPIEASMILRAFENPWRWVKLLGVIVLTYLLAAPAIILFVLVSMGAAVSGVDTAVMQLAIALIYLVGIIYLIFIMTRASLGILFVLDKDLEPITAMKQSFKATKNNVFAIFLLYILQTIIIMISLLPLGIGLIWTLPLATIVNGMIYKRLLVNVA